MIFNDDNRIRIISGHYGVGKSEFASNYALKLAKSPNRRQKIVIVDLDIVNPYFTTRGIKSFLEKNGIEIVGPSSEATHADLPALPREIDSVFFNENYDVIVDLGGDAAGSKVIGRYSEHLKELGYDFFYLINLNRPFSEDIQGVYQFLLDIQNASRLKVSHLVNSTHLLYDTSFEDIQKGDEVCKEISKQLKISYKYVVIPNFLIYKDNNDSSHLNEQYRNKFSAEKVFYLDITLRPVWLSDYS